MFLQHDCHTHPSNSMENGLSESRTGIPKSLHPNQSYTMDSHTAAPLQSIHSYGSIDMAVLRPLVVWQEGCISPEMAPLSFIASILELGHVSHASLTLSSHLPLTH
jgi:hypothetical protein